MHERIYKHACMHIRMYIHACMNVYTHTIRTKTLNLFEYHCACIVHAQADAHIMYLHVCMYLYLYIDMAHVPYTFQYQLYYQLYHQECILTLMPVDTYPVYNILTY